MTYDCERCHWDKQKAQHFKDCPCKCHETVQAIPEIPRCEKCGWPLAESVDKGCVVGNCSMRPIPKKHAEDSIKFWSDKYDAKVDELHEMWKEARSFEGSFNSAVEKIKVLEDEVAHLKESRSKWGKQSIENANEVDRLNGIIKKQTEEIEIHFRNEENCYQNLLKDQKAFEAKIKSLEAECASLKAEKEHLEKQLSMQTYNGNSIGYIYDKMVAYRGQVLPMANALKELGFDYSNSGNDNRERETTLMEWTHQTAEKLNSIKDSNLPRICKQHGYTDCHCDAQEPKEGV